MENSRFEVIPQADNYESWSFVKPFVLYRDSAPCGDFDLIRHSQAISLLHSVGSSTYS